MFSFVHCFTNSFNPQCLLLLAVILLLAVVLLLFAIIFIGLGLGLLLIVLQATAVTHPLCLMLPGMLWVWVTGTVRVSQI